MGFSKGRTPLENFVMLIFFVLSQTFIPYLDSSLAFIGLTEKDLSLRSDYTIPDAYRFSIIDSLMENPLGSVEFITSLEDKFWNLSAIEMLQNLIKLYPFDIEGIELNFRQILHRSNAGILAAFSDTPEELAGVFEELTLFSPAPTGSIEEEKVSEKRLDSLTILLKKNGKMVDFGLLFKASAWLLKLTLDYKTWYKNLKKPTKKIAGVQGNILFYENFEFGAIVVGDTGKNVYQKDFAVIIDLGGDELYQISSKKESFNIIVDAGGNDTYLSENYGIGCGHFGVSILIDEAGDDTYEAKSFSIGCGVFGIGMLIDRKGNDKYFGDTFTQGAGGFGIGILMDENGNDLYEGALYAQGFASTYGIGILADKNGNDMYLIKEKYLDEIRYLDHYLSLSQGFTIGFRPDLSAGIGIIFDGGGNDYYLADIFAQGSGYWYGLGAIVDDDGNDNFVAYQYAQGSGTHLALGLLVDKKGNDNYVSKGVSQGCGHDLALGWLYDMEGDDSYCAFDLSQGAGNANGIGILIDEKGDDNYGIKRQQNTQGYGDFRREFGSIGVLMDLKGKDFYPGGKDKSLWQRGKYGIGIDWD